MPAGARNRAATFGAARRTALDRPVTLAGYDPREYAYESSP